MDTILFVAIILLFVGAIYLTRKYWFKRMPGNDD